MAEIAVSLATSVAELTLNKVLSLVKEEVSAFYSAKDVIKSLENKLPEITELLAKFEDGRLNCSDNFKLKNWFVKLRVAAYDAENVLYSWTTEYQQWKMKKEVEKLLLPFSVSNLHFHYLVSRKLKKITARLDQILKDGENLRTSSSKAPVSETGALPEVPFESAVTRIQDRKGIIKQLTTDEESSNEEVFSFIHIVGMGGLGKTTLAQQVFDHFQNNDKAHFKDRIWVSVAENFVLENILMKILSSIMSEESRGHYDVTSLSLRELEQRIEEILQKKKQNGEVEKFRLLLVLDNFWATDSDSYMDKLKAVLRFWDKGSRVLVTSRNLEVSNIKGTKFTLPLQCLGDNESWSMFEKLAFREGKMTASPREELEVHGKKIVRRCKGLPLAIKQMAGLLGGVTDVARWRAIESSQTWKVDNSDSKNNYNVMSVLRLSYHHLPSFHKQCFAYCSLFPKAHVYEVEELVKLWMAEGFIEPDGEQRTEDIGLGYFEMLSDRFFFERTSTDDTKYRMHDLIHDLAQLISSPFFRQVVEMKDIDGKSFNEISRHVSLLSEEVEQPTSTIIRKSKKLRTLLFPVQQIKILGRVHRDIFHSLVYVWVLDLSWSTLQTLPESIEELKLLRYLDASKTEIKELPDSICKLYHLQTLKLLGCPRILSLPKKFKTLVNLRHLELDEVFWYEASSFPPSMGCLTNLHNLHKFQVGHNTGYKLEELKNMKYLTGRLHISNLENAVNAGKDKTNVGEGNTPQVDAEDANLKGKEMIEKLVYEWSDSKLNLQNEAIEKKVLEDLQPHSEIKEIRICHYRGTEFPSWIGGGQLRNLVTLVLNHCERIKILSFGELPHLQEVHLESMLELEEWQEQGYQYQDLKKINEETYQPLTTLILSNCPKLTKLPGCFSKLQVLKITNCDSLEFIQSRLTSFGTLADNAVMKSCGQLRNLVSLDLNHCERIKILSLGELPHLQKVHLESMLDLEEWQEEGYQDLEKINEETYQSLTTLMLSNCPKLTKLPGCFSKLQDLKITNCDSLEFIQPRLTSFGTLADNAVMKSGGQLRNLVTLVLNRCERIKILSLGELPHLQEVHLESMLELEKWEAEGYESLDSRKKTEEENYQPLIRLTVSNCPNLTKLPCCFSNLDVLKITKCEKLEIIPYGPMSLITLEDNAAMKHWGEESLQLKNFLEEDISDRHNETIARELEEVILEGHSTPISREDIISHFSSEIMDLKIVKCPALSTLPGGLHPRKLEISGCSSLSALPEENCATRLNLLALDSCQGYTLLRMIPSSPQLRSLIISNISDVRCLPTFPGLPKIETLHIHDCPDFEYLSTPENRLFERFTCLAILSIKNCPKLMTLPAEGLPTSLRYLSIGPCDCLNSFGPPDVLAKLNSLRDLYIEDCPALQSLPDDGLPASLPHLSIKRCPSLVKNCAKDSSDWPKIKDISDLEIETPSTETPSSSSGACFNISSLRGHSKGKKVLE